jgi:repressor LexA
METNRVKDFYNYLLSHGLVRNQQHFADRIGVDKGVISLLFVGKKRATPAFLKRVEAAFPEVSLTWLLSGEGSMLAETDTPTNNKNTLPLIPIEAVAGFPKGDADTPTNYERYAVPEFEARGAEFLIRVSGSSMYPKYSNGDILACRKIKDVLFFQWGKIYVIDSSQGALVKRVFESTDHPDCILCVSDNKENYPPFLLPKSDIRSLSLVLGVIRLE